MRRPTILVTRPSPEGTATAKALAKTAGVAVVECPLLHIETLGTLPEMTGIQGLIFTSRNGVRAYRDLAGPDLPAICVGEATAHAARDAGLTARVVGGDVDGLIAGLTAQKPDGPLLYLRGETIRSDIAGPLAAAGIETRQAIVYRQSLLDLSAEATDLLSGRRPVIVPLYSARTAARLSELARPRAPLYLVAMSAAVARAATLPAESKIIAEAPDAPAMIRAVLATLRRVEGMDRPH